MTTCQIGQVAERWVNAAWEIPLPSRNMTMARGGNWCYASINPQYWDFSMGEAPLLHDVVCVHFDTPRNIHEENTHLKRMKTLHSQSKHWKYHVHLSGDHKGVLLNDGCLGFLRPYGTWQV